MSDDAEWLRERPEIVEALCRNYCRFDCQTACDVDGDEPKEGECPRADQCNPQWRYDNQSHLTAAILGALPHLRAAIRADVVRELAWDVDGVRDRAAAYLVEHGWQANAVLGCIDFITRERAAAYAQGRAAGREEIKTIIECYGPRGLSTEQDAGYALALQDVLSDIRSLP